MMRELGRSIGNRIFENIGRAAGRVQEQKPLPSDLLESEDAYLVVFDAPGATATDVQVRYVDDRVEVRIDRFRDFYEDFEMVYPGRGLSLDGSVTLPEDAVVDAAGATATLREDGTLQVRIPKERGTTVPVGESADERGDETDEREGAGTPVGEEEGEADEAGETETEADAETGEDEDEEA